MRPVHGGCRWALALAVAASLLWVAPAGAETTVEVDAGYAGWFVPGQEVPVRVRVSADRLLRGTLEVAVGNPENGTPVAMAVEVPGGSQKQFLLTATAGLNQRPDVTAQLRQDDRVVASGQASLQATGDVELVGLLPGALRGRTVPGSAPLAVDAGTARFAALGETELEEAPASLGPLSTLAADVDELVRLSPAARAGVLRWIEGGGRLLVDSARGQPVPGLPDAWQPGARGRAGAGLGEVVATDGAIAAGRWSGLVEPSGRGLTNGFPPDAPLAGSLATDAGLRTPELGWLVGFLALYVVGVGPVLFLFLRRRGRPELAWVAVPLVAVVFSTGSYVVGRDLRNATQLVHATVLSSTETGGTATSYVGVFSRSGETVRVGFPGGWSSGSFAPLGQAPRPSLLTRTSEGLEARLPLDAGQFGIVNAAGPSSAGNGLDVEATVDGNGRIVGTVRNTTPFELDDVAVFVTSEGLLLGRVGPEEEREFTLTNAGRFGGEGAAFQVWAGARSGNAEMVGDYGLWQAALRMGGTGFLSPGAVVAGGWTRDFAPEVRVDGRVRRPEGRTLVLGRRQAQPGSEGPLGSAVRRDVVRDSFTRNGPAGRNAGSIVRFVLPAGADSSSVVLQSPFGAAEVWQDGAWRSVTCEGGGCRPPQQRPQVICAPNEACPVPPPFAVGGPGPMGFRGVSFPIPAGAVRDGVVYARVPGPASLEAGAHVTVGRAP